MTSGASSDIQQATRLARAMVTKYGMSSKLGMLFVDEKEKFGGEITKAVDDEVNDLLSHSYERAKTLLESHRKELEQVAMGLVEHETLSGAEVVDLINGKKIASSTKRSQKPSRELKAVTNRPRAPAAVAAATNGPPSANKAAPATKLKAPANNSNSSGGDKSSPPPAPSAKPSNESKGSADNGASADGKPPRQWGNAFQNGFFGWFSKPTAPAAAVTNAKEASTSIKPKAAPVDASVESDSKNISNERVGEAKRPTPGGSSLTSLPNASVAPPAAAVASAVPSDSKTKQ